MYSHLRSDFVQWVCKGAKKHNGNFKKKKGPLRVFSSFCLSDCTSALCF